MTFSEFRASALIALGGAGSLAILAALMWLAWIWIGTIALILAGATVLWGLWYGLCTYLRHEHHAAVEDALSGAEEGGVLYR